MVLVRCELTRTEVDVEGISGCICFRHSSYRRVLNLTSENTFTDLTATVTPWRIVNLSAALPHT